MTEKTQRSRYRKPIPRTPWNEPETQQAARLWRSGATASEIARRLGKSRNAVLGKIGRLGLKRNGNGVTGHGYRRPARRARLSRPVHPSSKPWFRWTREHEERLEAYWLDGLSADEIAARFGCSEGAANARAARLGLVRAEYPERYVSEHWYAANNARFVSAMRSAIEAGTLRLPCEVPSTGSTVFE